MFFGGMPGGIPGMGGMGGVQQREPPDTEALYKTLGLPKSCSAAEIKKAFRKKALRMHPDKGGDPEEFKKLQAAYEVLSDADKRQIYDQHGLEGLEQGGGGGGGGMGDIFDLFGGGRRGRGGKPKVEPLVFTVRASLEHLYNGKTVLLAYSREALKGAPKKCPTCRGTGVTVQQVQIGPGMVTQAQAQCRDCTRGYRCASKKERVEVEVRVDKGAADKSKIKLPGRGNEAPGAEPGDVHFVVETKPHKAFQRHGADLLLRKDIGLVEALTGFDFVVDTLDGRKLGLKARPGQIVRPEVRAGVPYVMCVDGEGMPKYGNPFDKGRLFVLFHIKFPRNGSLSGAAKKQLLEALPPALEHETIGADAATLEKLKEKNECIRLDEDPEDCFLTPVSMDDFGQGVGANPGEERGADEEDGGGQRRGPGGGQQCQQM